VGAQGAIITRDEGGEVRRLTLIDPAAPGVEQAADTSKPRKGRGKHFTGKPSKPVVASHAPSLQQTNMDHW
jgi:hypothetical protein